MIEEKSSKLIIKSLRLELVADNDFVYSVELEYGSNGDVQDYWNKRKKDVNQVLSYAVYLSRGLASAFEKRAGLLHQNNKLTDKAKMSLIKEYKDTGIELLGIVVGSKHLFPKSKIIYVDPETGNMFHSGVVVKARLKVVKAS